MCLARVVVKAWELLDILIVPCMWGSQGKGLVVICYQNPSVMCLTSLVYSVCLLIHLPAAGGMTLTGTAIRKFSQSQRAEWARHQTTATGSRAASVTSAPETEHVSQTVLQSSPTTLRGIQQMKTSLITICIQVKKKKIHDRDIWLKARVNILSCMDTILVLFISKAHVLAGLFPVI